MFNYLISCSLHHVSIVIRVRARSALTHHRPSSNAVCQHWSPESVHAYYDWKQTSGDKLFVDIARWSKWRWMPRACLELIEWWAGRARNEGPHLPRTHRRTPQSLWHCSAGLIDHWPLLVLLTLLRSFFQLNPLQTDHGCLLDSNEISLPVQARGQLESAIPALHALLQAVCPPNHEYRAYSHN